jgi:zinc protease
MDFTSYKLANGLRVLLAPDQTEFGVAVNITFDAGSRNERPEQAGLAHLLQNIVLQNLHQAVESEHRETDGETLKPFEGVINLERASYFSELTTSQLDLVLSTLARQMRVPKIHQTAIDEQRLVILEECRQSQDKPFDRVQDTLLELIYNNLAYKYGAICSLGHLNHLSLEEARSFFKTYYAPNNAVIVIVGNFKEDDTKKIVEKHFGILSRQAAPPDVDVIDPLMFSLERRQTLNDSHADAPFYMSAYVTVPSDHPDWYALNLLADIIGQGNTSRLYLALVAKNLASSVPEGMTESRGPSLLYVGTRLLPDASVETVEAVMDAEIARIQSDGVMEAEMEKARLQEREYSAGQLRTPLGKAGFLARSTLYYNDPNRLNTELGRLLAVTAQEVQRVARKYLVKTNRAVVIAVPETSR